MGNGFLNCLGLFKNFFTTLFISLTAIMSWIRAACSDEVRFAKKPCKGCRSPVLCEPCYSKGIACSKCKLLEEEPSLLLIEEEEALPEIPTE